MPIDMDALYHLVPLHIAFAPRAQDGHFIAICLQRDGFLPYTRVERNWKVLNDDEDFSSHAKAVSALENSV
jgi:hypothetical protein